MRDDTAAIRGGNGVRKALYIGHDAVLAQRVLRFLLASGIDPTERRLRVDVLHDEWCPILDAGNRCACSPEFRVDWSGE